MEGSTSDNKLAVENEDSLTTGHPLSNPTEAPPNPVDMQSSYAQSQIASANMLRPPPYSRLPENTASESQRASDALSTVSQCADPGPRPPVPAVSPTRGYTPINSGHSQTSAMSNAGMLGGMALGMGEGGGNLGADMATGMWIGSVVGQRMAQHEKREQIQIAAANGTLDPNSRAGKRYERRSKRRRDRSKKIKKLFGGGSSSSSESGHD